MSSSARNWILVASILGLASCRSANASHPPAHATTTVTAERISTPTGGSGTQPSRTPKPSSAAPAIPLARFASGDPPAYPEMSRRLHEEGTVELEIGLLDDGTVKELAVGHSSGHPRLDDAALEAARTWRFHPRTGAGGIDRIRHRVVFQLTD
jgi:protein TonB